MVAGVVQLGLREDTGGRHPGPASRLAHGEVSELSFLHCGPREGTGPEQRARVPRGLPATLWASMGPEGVKWVPALSSLISFPDKQCAVTEK